MSWVGELWLGGLQLCMRELLPWMPCERAALLVKAEMGNLHERAAGTVVEQTRLWQGLAHEAWVLWKETNFTCLPIEQYPDPEVSMGVAWPRHPLPLFLLLLSFDSAFPRGNSACILS